jgi:hypothetical protein
MKIKISVSIGLVGCKQEETIEIDDEELDGYDEKGRNRLLDEIALEHVMQMIEWGWKSSDE